MKIVLSKGQKLWFASDTHYNHGGICSATTSWKSGFREFPSLESMNDTLVNNINDKVGENDILIHLGDWSFGGFDSILEFRNRIKCKNIHLVLGDHDHHIERNKNNIQNIFTSVHNYLNLDLRIQHKEFTEKYRFVCMHFPISSWDGLARGVMHLFGHVHLPTHLRVMEGKAMDVGVDGNNLEPISLQEVLDILKKQPNKHLTLPQDHHEFEQ
jgi:calcineurin-like phosphoesterase family protein